VTQLFEGIAINWQAARQAYSYPAVRLVVRSASDANISESRLSWGEIQLTPDVSTAHLSTNEEIESYHRNLLLSDEPNNRAIGAASVVYWGNFAGSNGKINGYSLVRAKHLIWGRQRKSSSKDVNKFDESLRNIYSSTANARGAVLRGDVEEAFRHFGEIAYVGPSFASKMVAFCMPNKAGVLDSVIANNLANRFEHSIFPTVSKELRYAKFSKKLSEHYRAWCEICEMQANKLNQNGQTWKAGDGIHRKWRAVDVERAIFWWSAK